jgi:hypothetical protein
MKHLIVSASVWAWLVDSLLKLVLFIFLDLANTSFLLFGVHDEEANGYLKVAYELCRHWQRLTNRLY